GDQGIYSLPASQAQRRGRGGSDPLLPRRGLHDEGLSVALSLRLRFAISFAVAFLLTLALLFFTLHYSLRNILVSDLDDDLDTLSEALVGEVSRSGAAPRPEALVAALNNGPLDRLTGTPVITAVFDPDGNLIRATRSLPVEGRALRPS